MKILGTLLISLRSASSFTCPIRGGGAVWLQFAVVGILSATGNVHCGFGPLKNDLECGLPFHLLLNAVLCAVWNETKYAISGTHSFYLGS